MLTTSWTFYGMSWVAGIVADAIIYAAGHGGGGIGVSIDLSNIMPIYSGGGGKYGINPRWTTKEGTHLYKFYTPKDEYPIGISFGIGISVDICRGWGDWSWEGPFDEYGGGLFIITASYAKSPPKDSAGGVWSYSVGPSAPPWISAYGVRTVFERIW